MLVSMHTKKLNLDKCMIKENISKWIEQDIIVPDTKPDAIKIINVTVTPYVNDYEVMDGKIKVIGKINYFVIYLVNDEKFNTRGLFVSYPYTEILNVDNLKNNMNISIDSKCKNTLYSLPNERKISVKSEIEFDVIIKDKITIDVIEGFEDTNNIECKMENKIFNNIIQNKCNIIASKEDIMLPKEADDFIEILDLRVKIENTEYKESYNKIMVKGDINVKIIYLADNQNENIKKLNFTVPFSAMVEVENINEKSKFDIKYKMRDFNVKLNEDITSTKTLNAQYQIEVELKMYKEENLKYVDDFYSQNKELEYDDNVVEVISQNNEFINKLELKENLINFLPMNSVVLDYNVDTNNINTSLKNGVLEINGNAKVNLIIQDLSSLQIENRTVDVLVNESIVLDGIEKNIEKSIKGYSKINNDKVFVTQNGNDIEIKIFFEIITILEKVANINNISKIEEKNLNMKDIDSINIYVVKPGDTVWKIAKKYKTSVEKIANSNELGNPDEINVGQKLLIIR